MVMTSAGPIKGTITSAKGHYLRIKLCGRKTSGLYHPTDGLQYVTSAGAEEDL